MPDETFWEDIHQLPGGHYLELKNRTLSISKWYVFEEEVKKFDEKIPFNDVKEKYAALLKNSIELRFRADVSVGFNISGGLIVLHYWFCKSDGRKREYKCLYFLYWS